MIYSVSGKLVHSEPSFAVVSCGGVGYKCMCTFETMRRLPPVGGEVTLLTHMQVREDGVELFGFYTAEELNCFKMLISVSGVGPRVALSVLSDATPERFALYVASGDYKSITRAQGVGPKLAQRIVLELKDKVAGIGAGEDISAVAAAASDDRSSLGEALSALVVLGYSHAEAASALAKLDQGLSAPELIREALVQLGKGMRG